MNRRTFTVGLIGFATVSIGQETRDRETSITVLDAGGGAFMVGVRTTLNASHYLAEVFYKASTPEIKGELLLHQESLGPVAGNEGYGATNQNFTCPRDKVQFIRITFFQKLEEREFR